METVWSILKGIWWVWETIMIFIGLAAHAIESNPLYTAIFWVILIIWFIYEFIIWFTKPEDNNGTDSETKSDT